MPSVAVTGVPNALDAVTRTVTEAPGLTVPAVVTNVPPLML